MKIVNSQNDLFSNELKILKNANEIINKEECQDNYLLAQFSQLANGYEKLLSLAGKIMNISDSQGKELKRREMEINNILNNSNQGFLKFGPGLIVDREYSLECERIFNRKISGVSILELLCKENAEQNKLLAEALSDIFLTDNQSQKIASLDKLPKILKINDRFINVKYKLIEDEVGPLEDKIMLILTNITDQRKAEDQVLYLSYHDKLTSLYNRAYIDNIAQQLLSELPLSVIMVDVNGLKFTNDVFGHQKGDQLLVGVADILVRCCRRNDLIDRRGGDEFLVLLPGVSRRIAEIVYGRIKKMFLEARADPVRPSVSLGMETLERPDCSMSELISLADDKMYNNKNEERKAVRQNFILQLQNYLQEKCLISKGHIERVKRSSINLAKILKLNEQSTDIDKLLLLADLHDMGKITIPEEIVLKPGFLTTSEWETIKSYTKAGSRVAQSLGESAVSQDILALRERWDGSGYPFGLKGEQIPLAARIVSLVEAYDVMTHDSHYKKSISKEKALEEIGNCSGKQFDPDLAAVFLGNVDFIIP